ncbi:GNAT family N-acetyltransferase [Providencia sp.]|uniref:GNAT family N-acetyltransferase n=1 Tax=Providencia sp. TaxID=589 RepID=UPI0033411290
MKKIYQWTRQNYRITTDTDDFDIPSIHQYLVRSSWAKGIDLETVTQSISHSLSFSLFYDNKQIGFARVVTDWATFGYLCDVYILEEYQRQKLGLWLMECCHSHPLMMRLRRLMLVTSTAPWLYEKVGYNPINREDFVWEIVRPDIYQKME